MSESQIVLFKFEDAEIRTITGADGTGWFVLKDILAAAKSKSTTTQAISSVEEGLGKGYVADIPLMTAGGTQQTKIVSEAAATFLISRSATEAGKELNKFLHVTVLPQIRKTGAYLPQAADSQIPQQRAATQLKAELEIGALLGVPLHLSQLEAVKSVHRETGLDYRPLLALSSAQDNLAPEDVMLEPADIAKRLNIKDGAAVNKWLEDCKLQVKEGKTWVPTLAGKPYCAVHQWSTAFKSGYNLKWSLAHLRSLMPKNWPALTN